jgi:hypothetical protein
MNVNRARNFWGLALILVGLFFLAVNIGIVPELSANLWAIGFAVLGLIFLAGYFISGIDNWWVLFPGLGSLAIAATIWLVTAGVAGNLAGGLFLLVISVPFWAAFLANRKTNWWALIPGWSMAAVGVIVLLVDLVPGEVIGSLVMFAIALPFVVVYVSNREHWWALIPAYVLTAIGVIILLESLGGIGDELFVALILFAVAFPFLVVYLHNRENWWALIPAGILALVGVVFLFTGTMGGELFAAVLMFAIALPFYFVFFRSPESWWGLIPAGVLTTVGAVVLIAGAGLPEGDEERLISTVLLAGIALTFGVLWLARSKARHTDWAKYPAAVLALAAALVFVFGIRVELIWSLALIGFGGWLLYRGTRPQKGSSE